jgi:hypothetical protein
MRSTIIVSVMVLMFLFAGCSDDDDNGTGLVFPPDTPAGLAVTARGLTSLTLSWDVSDGATEYNLSRSLTDSGDYSEVYSGAAAGFVDNSLPYNSTYYYRVVAENSGGESGSSPYVYGTTLTPDGFVVTGSPSGIVDYTYNYFDQLNGYSHYRSDPIGLNLVVQSSGPQDGLWIIHDQIEQMSRYYNPTAALYPPLTGWLAVSDDVATSIVLTAF